jgi:hypothetical protein
MKKIFYSLLAIILIASSACKKDTVKVPPKAFEDITYQDIKGLYDETGFTFQEIIISTQKGGDVLKPGSVILYKISTNVCGKFKIVSISSQNTLTLDMVNYNETTGIVLKDKKSATVNASFYFDLKNGLESASVGVDGFNYDVYGTDLDRRLLPLPTTRMYVYSK